MLGVCWFGRDLVVCTCFILTVVGIAMSYLSVPELPAPHTPPPGAAVTCAASRGPDGGGRRRGRGCRGYDGRGRKRGADDTTAEGARPFSFSPLRGRRPAISGGVRRPYSFSGSRSADHLRRPPQAISTPASHLHPPPPWI
jgi:hypothetical protein